MRKLVITLGVVLSLSACAPTPECDQACADNVNAAIMARAQLDANADAGDIPSTKQVIREEFAGSGESESWLFAIVQRESNFIPWAANPRSAARGLFQIMIGQHQARFAQVGCDVSQWANARCNAKVARLLHNLAGRSPWAL